MRYVWSGMEKPVNSVTAVAFHDAIAMGLYMLLNHITNLSVSFTGLYDGNSLL